MCRWPGDSCIYPSSWIGIPGGRSRGESRIRWTLLPALPALEEAFARYGAPEIFNTDQGAQFTSEAFTAVLRTPHITMSIDGKRRWIDNVFVERLWRSVKYEDLSLRTYDTPAALQRGLTHYFLFYNSERRHQAFNRQTPDAVHFADPEVKEAA